MIEVKVEMLLMMTVVDGWRSDKESGWGEGLSTSGGRSSLGVGCGLIWDQAAAVVGVSADVQTLEPRKMCWKAADCFGCFCALSLGEESTL